jgi:hypothetical protein
MAGPFDNDAPLVAHRDGIYTGNNGQAPFYARHPYIVAAPASNTGDTGISVIDLPDYVHIPSGSGPVWIEVKLDSSNLRSEQYWYRNNLGVSTMTSGANVGVNPAVVAAARTQFFGSFGRDYFNATAAAITITANDIINNAITAVTQVRKSDGTARTVIAADFIASIDIDLKPTGGHVDVAGVQTTTTSSDAKHTRGGGVYDIDPGGSSNVGEARDSTGYLIRSNSGDIVLAPGSGIVVSVDLASLPA